MKNMVANLVSSYNVREGVKESDDKFTQCSFTVSLPENGSVMKSEDFAKMKSYYYRLRGWN